MKLKSLIVFFLAAIILSINIFCSQTVAPSYPVLTSYASLNDSVKYAGMNTCKQCHADVYETFSHTGMGSSFDIATKNKTSATFDKHTLVYDKFKNFFYKPFWDGDSLRLMEFRLDGKDTVHKLIETINFIVGSGQHTNSHMMNTNGYLNQVPATFYTQKGKWDLPPGFEDGGNTRFSRIIGLECMSCHNAYPKFVLGSENKFTEVKNGIDCERCHGPGDYHVKQKQLGILVDTSKAIDYSIVNPAKLSIDLQFDICQRCHIQGNAILNNGKSFFDFKPGMNLSEVMNVFMPVYRGNNNEHIMASHVERLKLSKCYSSTMQKIKTANTTQNNLRPYKNALTCVTCHNPHISVRVTENAQFNTTCKSCHSTSTEIVCAEKIEVRKKENDNCIKCHMTASGATDIPHVSVHDHLIQKPYKQNEIGKIKEFVGIACINNSNPPEKAIGDAYIAYFEKFSFDKSVLDSALMYLPYNSKSNFEKNFTSLIQLYFLKKDYAKVIALNEQEGITLKLLNNKSYSNVDAWACYRIAESYQNTNNISKAILFYKRAAELAPYHLDILNKYATALSISGDTKNAKYVFEKILEEYPKHVSALTNLGFLYLTVDNNPEKANQFYTKAMQLNPDYEPLLLNRAGLFLYQNNIGAAKKIMEYVLKLNPNNERAKQILLQLKSAEL